MQELLEYIVKSLVSKPEEVKITEDRSGSEISLNLTVDPSDMGIVIGKSGQTIRSIRKLLITRAMAEGENVRVNLNLQEIK